MTTACSPKVLVFVPTYNDFEFLSEIVDQVARFSPHYKVLIVNDGSPRPLDPAPLLRGRSLYFRLPDNAGLGVCTQIAFDHTLRQDYHLMARIDADGQHPVERLPELLAPLLADEADVVVGARRNHRQSGLAGWLSAFIKGYYFWVGRLLTQGRCPSDLNTGFFALNRKAILLLNEMEIERYPEPLFFIKACRYRLRVAEVGVEQNQRRFGQSSLTVFQALRMFYRFNMAVLTELLQKKPTR